MYAKTTAALLAATGMAACTTANGYGPGNGDGASGMSPGGDYRKVSELVALPDFIPGMGTLYVQPDTLPAGPFLAYDRDGDHVSTIYMIPLDRMNEKAAWKGLSARGRSVRSVDLEYNPGHPGVEEPHYHVTLWHVPKTDAELEEQDA